MDPIFAALNQVPRVLLVAGYVDDTTTVGTQRDPEWIKEVFQLVCTWSAAGVVVDEDIVGRIWISPCLLLAPCKLKGEELCAIPKGPIS